jgi:hypothetical protein
MGLTHFPHGISTPFSTSGGARFSSPWNTHYFVDGDNGNDGNVGTEPTKAFKTIQKAVTASTGGDVIYIRPKSYTMGTGFARYTEDVTVTTGGTAGSGNTVPNARKSLIGVTPLKVASDFLGVRWKFASTTNLNVEAAGTHIENIGFFCEGATAGVYFEGDGSTWGKNGHTGSSMYNCSVKGEGGVLANGSDSLQIINCQFQAKYDGNTSGIIITLDGTNVMRRPVVRGCHFIGGNGSAMDSAPIIWTGGTVDGLIADNYFGLGTSVQINIATAGSTGLIVNNYFAEANLSTTFIVQNGMVCVANYDLTGLAASV